MNTARSILAAFAIGLVLSAPAHAANSVALPDPSGLTLFTLGVTGLIIGRRIASKRRD